MYAKKPKICTSMQKYAPVNHSMTKYSKKKYNKLDALATLVTDPCDVNCTTDTDTHLLTFSECVKPCQPHQSGCIEQFRRRKTYTDNHLLIDIGDTILTSSFWLYRQNLEGDNLIDE